jgi:hypothetical protein
MTGTQSENAKKGGISDAAWLKLCVEKNGGILWEKQKADSYAALIQILNEASKNGTRKFRRIIINGHCGEGISPGVMLNNEPGKKARLSVEGLKADEEMANALNYALAQALDPEHGALQLTSCGYRKEYDEKVGKGAWDSQAILLGQMLGVPLFVISPQPVSQEKTAIGGKPFVDNGEYGYNGKFQTGYIDEKGMAVGEDQGWYIIDVPDGRIVKQPPEGALR